MEQYRVLSDPTREANEVSDGFDDEIFGGTTLLEEASDRLKDYFGIIGHNTWSVDAVSRALESSWDPSAAAENMHGIIESRNTMANSKASLQKEPSIVSKRLIGGDVSQEAMLGPTVAQEKYATDFPKFSLVPSEVGIDMWKPEGGVTSLRVASLEDFHESMVAPQLERGAIGDSLSGTSPSADLQPSTVGQPDLFHLFAEQENGEKGAMTEVWNVLDRDMPLAKSSSGKTLDMRSVNPTNNWVFRDTKEPESREGVLPLSDSSVELAWSHNVNARPFRYDSAGFASNSFFQHGDLLQNSGTEVMANIPSGTEARTPGTVDRLTEATAFEGVRNQAVGASEPAGALYPDVARMGMHGADGTGSRPMSDFPGRNNLIPGDGAGMGMGNAGASGMEIGAAVTTAPGWLVALTGAVVTELSNSLFRSPLSASESATVSQRGAYAASGTRSDPLHVKLVDQAIPYQSHMPVGPSVSLPSQSLPIPGQVMFSP